MKEFLVVWLGILLCMAGGAAISAKSWPWIARIALGALLTGVGSAILVALGRAACAGF